VLRFKIASMLGLVEPLVRLQRAADAAARASVRATPRLHLQAPRRA
jgi:hypothetical protein